MCLEECQKYQLNGLTRSNTRKKIAVVEWASRAQVLTIPKEGCWNGVGVGHLTLHPFFPSSQQKQSAAGDEVFYWKLELKWMLDHQPGHITACTVMLLEDSITHLCEQLIWISQKALQALFVSHMQKQFSVGATEATVKIQTHRKMKYVRNQQNVSFYILSLYFVRTFTCYWEEGMHKNLVGRIW